MALTGPPGARRARRAWRICAAMRWICIVGWRGACICSSIRQQNFPGRPFCLSLRKGFWSSLHTIITGNRGACPPGPGRSSSCSMG
jgi:hypothetical protein